LPSLMGKRVSEAVTRGTPVRAEVLTS